MSLHRVAEARSFLVERVVSAAMSAAAENIESRRRDSAPDVADDAVLMLDSGPERLRELFSGFISDVDQISNRAIAAAAKEASALIYAYYRGYDRLPETPAPRRHHRR